MPYIRLRRGKTCDGHAVRRAGNVVQADFVAEFYGRRVAAVLAAYTDMQFLSFALTKLNGSFHKLTYADGIQTAERVAFVNLISIVRRQEFARVVAREAESHLR